MAFVTVTLVGGPLDQQQSELFDPGDTVDAGVPEGWYVRRADDPMTYDWTEGVKPTATADAPFFIEPLPATVADHIQHLRDYLAADPATITTPQTVHVVKDLIRAVQYLNRRLE